MKQIYKTLRYRLKPTQEMQETLEEMMNKNLRVYNTYFKHYVKSKTEGKPEATPIQFNNFLLKKGFIKEDHRKVYLETLRLLHKRLIAFVDGKDDAKPTRYTDPASLKLIVKCEKVDKNHFDIHPLKGPVLISGKNEIQDLGGPVTGCIKKEGDKYYLLIQVYEEVDDTEELAKPKTEGLGLDLGLRFYVILSDGTAYSYDEIKKRLHEINHTIDIRTEEIKKIKARPESKTGQRKLKEYTRLIAKAEQKKINIMKDFQDKIIADIVKRNPEYITMEHLNVDNMMRTSGDEQLNRRLKDAHFELFTAKLTRKAKMNGIELRLVSQYYPSTQTCSKCGQRLKGDEKVKLGQEVYRCKHCGAVIDRDLNAAINLKNVRNYKII